MPELAGTVDTNAADVIVGSLVTFSPREHLALSENSTHAAKTIALAEEDTRLKLFASDRANMVIECDGRVLSQPAVI